MLTSGRFDINGWSIYYEIYGNGPHKVLLIPGAIGDARSDFLPQLEGLHALDQSKYTFVCINLPGWGKSTPKRAYGPNVYNIDVECSAKLMQNLGINSYSTLGWSEGSKCALMMASAFPGRIRRCVIMGTETYATEHDIKVMLQTRNTKIWDPKTLDLYRPIYGDKIQEVWDDYIDFCASALKFYPEGFGKQTLSKVQCPLLIMHGDVDPMVTLDHPMFILKNVSNASLHRFPTAAHNLHHSHPKEFKKLVEDFLDDEDEY